MLPFIVHSDTSRRTPCHSNDQIQICAMIAAHYCSRNIVEQIVLIEENESLRGALSETLRQMGYCVHEAAGGGEALALAGRIAGSIDLVISDLVMPDMNAMELYSGLQEHAYSGKMLIITRYPMPHTGMSLAALPNVIWAKKPIGKEELRLILAQMLETRPGPTTDTHPKNA